VHMLQLKYFNEYGCSFHETPCALGVPFVGVFY
jgi:hypothetical protein